MKERTIQLAKLTKTQVKEKLSIPDGWSLENGQITKTFQLQTFPLSIVFVRAVAQVAEAANHHPDVLIKWCTVKLSLTTHDVNGLSEKDFELAEQINRVPQK